MARHRNECFWQADLPPLELPSISRADHYDVVIVGGGYSGLATALGLARRGASVLLAEKHQIGHGCSSRNGGMVGPSFHKLGMAGLTRHYGADLAMRLQGEALTARRFFEDFLQSEALDCDYRITGRFRGARSAADFAALREESADLEHAVGLNWYAVGPSECQAHIGSPGYAGGVVYPDDGGIHPARLVRSLAEKALSHGAHLCPETPVQGITRAGPRWRVELHDGAVTAGEVVIATNGYASRATPGMHARVVPISVAVTATRPLGEAAVRAMSPKLMMHSETGRVFVWSRPSPDGQRFIFGGRFAAESLAPARKAEKFARALRRIYPDLAAADFEQFWHGWVGYSADHAPHLGRIDGHWHLGGYCGSGVTRSIYFADKLVRKITGEAGSETAFDQLTFPKVRFRPLAGIGASLLTEWNKWRDGVADRRARR